MTINLLWYIYPPPTLPPRLFRFHYSTDYRSFHTCCQPEHTTFLYRFNQQASPSTFSTSSLIRYILFLNMGGYLENVTGYGQLSLGQAVHIAQNSEGGVDQRLAQFLERRLADVWAKLNAQPTSYILPADEFALLNYYRPRFGDSSIVKDATKRFWDNHKGTA